MPGEVYAMHETALTKYLEELDVIRVLTLENPKALSLFGKDALDDDDEDYDTDEEGMATIKVSGPLSQNGPSPIAKFFGMDGTGYSQITKALQAAAADPAVKAITLGMNTPGGEVHGVDPVWNTIRQLTKTKPITARNDGMIASAGYYIASACDQVLASSPTNETGSIGVVIAGYDDSAAREKAGVRKVAIYSKGAPNKASAFDTEKGRALLQDRADAFERVFHARVGEGRGIAATDVSEKFGAGGIFLAQDPDRTRSDALSMGLIDGMVGVPGIIKKNVPNPFGASTVSPPASAGNVNPEETMNLQEYLASNPSAKVEVDALVAAATAVGKKSAEALAQRVGTILAADGYKANPVISAKALECLSGKISLETFESVITMADMMASHLKVAAATGSTVVETAGQVHGAKPTLTAEIVKAFTYEQIQALSEADLKVIYADKALATAYEAVSMKGGN